MTTKLKIAGLGEVLWDIHGDVKTFGGAPGNCACHCHFLGAQAYVVSCLGNDELGAEARAFLNGHGIDTSCLAGSDEFETGVVNVTLDEKGKPEYEIKEGVAWDNIPFTDAMAELAPQLDAVAFGTLSQRNDVSKATIEKFLQATSDQCLRMFDINIRLDYHTPEIIKSSLKLANALKINDEELPLLTEMFGLSGTDEEQLKTIMKKFELKFAILTYGPRGALMMTKDKKSFAIPPDLDPVTSTVGAGDSFTATALMGFLRNKDLDAINVQANEVATFVCSQTGAVPKIPQELVDL